MILIVGCFQNTFTMREKEGGGRRGQEALGLSGYENG